MLTEDMASSDVVMIPARRFRVSTDLGTVREGDHVLVIGNVVVALDTSRVPEHRTPPMITERPIERAAKTRKISSSRLNADHVFNVILQFSPISSMDISDKLGFDRSDSQTRGKVSRLLQAMVSEGRIRRYQDDRIRQFRYELPKSEQAEVVAAPPASEASAA